MANETNSLYYNKIAKGYNELHSEEQKNKLKIIKEFINPNKQETLLDVGCGTGVSSDFDCDITGIDPSEELLSYARGGKFIKAQAENMPFEDNSFDYVISVTAVHNFLNIEEGLNEIKRVAKKSIVLSILKKSPKYNLISELIRKKFKLIKEIDESKDAIFILEK